MGWKIVACTVLLLGAMLGTLSSSQAGIDPTSGSTSDRSIEIGGLERTYRVHLPALAPPTNGFPVLIVLHGGGGNGKQVEHSTGFSDLADREGFIAVYPDGTGRLPKRLTWNAYNCCAYAHAKDIDDVSFISALIAQLISDYEVDPARIYVTGHSNGAMMTFRLACELADQIAAAAPFAGALNTDGCIPASPVPMLIMNGEDDTNVPVAGGTSPNVGYGGEDSRIDMPTSFAVATWVAANGCTGGPTVVNSPAALTTRWTDCANGSMVEQVLIHDWEHSWPSIEDGAPIDASRVIWDFVSQFSKPGT